ncbi:MAG: hypothetical protein R3D27_07580 [Hyphomicrobiaceae bacterium]
MLRLVLIAVVAAVAFVFLQKVEWDERLMWAALLPITYIAGLIVLRD